jgi:hypothetical protein
MISNFEDFYEFMIPLLGAKCPPAYLFQHLKEAFRWFTYQTESWTEEIEDIDMEEDEATYRLNPTYDALIKRILWVKINGGEIGSNQYELANESQLKFKTDYVPTYDLTAGIDVKVVLYPDVGSDTEPENYLTRWKDGILHRALWTLFQMRGRPWYDPAMADDSRRACLTAFAGAVRERHTEFKSGRMQVNHALARRAFV